MILTKLEIIKQVKKGNISISPFNEDMLNSNSVNYRLDRETEKLRRSRMLEMQKKLFGGDD